MKVTTLETLKRVGGHPALDFINTVHHWRGEGPDRDYLHDYAGLLRWSFDTGVLDARERRELTRTAEANLAAAEQVYREAVKLRELLHDVFQASAAGRAPAPESLQALNAWSRRAAHSRVLAVDRLGRLRPDWNFAPGELPLQLPLLKLTAAAIELALSAEAGRLKECMAEPGCGWLFYDSSKNRSRRWCDMQDCGNLAKSRRHYARTHGQNS